MASLRDLVDELLHAKVKAKLFGGDHAPQLGRLRLLDRLGAGAMGTVFAAYDPRLDRKVAVKVLRTTDGAARVLAEARALAKLAHPNVVAVHDADELDGLVYIVMELAPGVPLRAWIASRRDWRDVLRVLREAGTGIAAAHTAGLVHRDIKPDNILVSDDRTRVVDFGLADAQGGGDGTSAGTPFFMAPEVLAGATATAASDQFSFGVTMYEALYGKRPYELDIASTADTVPAAAYARGHAELLTELRSAAGRAGDAPRPPGSDVPAWLHAIVARSLAAEPALRFGSMDELVEALGHDRRRRVRLLGLAAGALVAGTLIGGVAMRGDRGNPCGGGASRTQAIWNVTERERVSAALAGAAWTPQTLSALDAHVVDWQTSYRRVCEATRVRGDQSDTLLDVRMRCLEHALSRFAALSSQLAPGLDPAARTAAPGAVGELPAPAQCEVMTSAADLAMPTDPAQRTRAVAGERELDRAWAAFVLGRYANARTIVDDTERALTGVDAPRLRAALLALSASIEARVGKPDVARALLDQALLAAAAAGAPEIEHEVWSRRMRSELFAGDPAKVIEWATFARAAAKRSGREGAEIDGIVGEALRAAGQLDGARELLERALASKDTLRPEQRALLEMNLGSVQLASGDSTAALATFTRARDRVLTSLGAKHPDLALYADKLAAANRARGKLRDALRLHDASLALRIAAFGPDDRAVATSLLYRAQTWLEGGEVDNARKDIDRSLEIRRKIYGADSPRLGEVYAVLGDILAATGIRDIAAINYERAATLDSRLDLTARRHANGLVVLPDAFPAFAADETLSVDRAASLVARIEKLVATKLATEATQPVASLVAKQGTEATQVAAQLRARFDVAKDPALGFALGAAQLAAGDREAAATILAALVPTLSNEPTRTALRIFIALAQAYGADERAPAAARAAISLYQAMPRLERGPVYDEMWTISRR